ncbi:MAG: DUF4404 domain-containing protein [Porticoccus sp.]|jgi:uncharacterized protein YjgD (DUF1641 family)|nr:DUF4404 domain-containing protein [Porticoccus sp.]|tara:strand:- start:2088 stop:2369 length:282 start_codon:yes stop_codon:yes gene_type:complete
MTMSNENDDLRDQLATLHNELEKAKTLDPEDRDMLGHLMSDMIRIAQGDLEKEPHHESLREQLERKAGDFDLDHPRLAGVVRQLLDSLGKMGI